MGKKREQVALRSSSAEYLTYIASVGTDESSFEVRYEDENIWLTQKMLATLYDVDVRTVNYHIKKVFADAELDEADTIRKFRIVQQEGEKQVERAVNHYDLKNIELFRTDSSCRTTTDTFLNWKKQLRIAEMYNETTVQTSKIPG